MRTRTSGPAGISNVRLHPLEKFAAPRSGGGGRAAGVAALWLEHPPYAGTRCLRREGRHGFLLRGRTRLPTILLVDDEPEFRDVMATILARAGHKVLAAADGYEGVRVLSEHWVDLLITDVRMPGVDGLQLARQAKVMRPNIRIIYISGFETGLGPDAGPTYGPVLAKPIEPPDLLAKIGHALA
jgi:two-component system, cell cycle response regulator CpdR